MSIESIRAARACEPCAEIGCREQSEEPLAGRAVSEGPKGMPLSATFVSVDDRGGLLTIRAGDQDITLELHLVRDEGRSRAWWFDADGELIQVAWVARC